MPTNQTFLHSTHDGLTMLAYPGDGSVLIAFDLDDKPEADFAGFDIQCTPPEGKPYYLLNRLNFSNPITAETNPSQRKYTASNKAPFQKFRWVHIPAVVKPGEYTYKGTMMHFKPGGGLKKGASTSLSFEMSPETYENFEFGFTRGYLSSQAYADKFRNAPIRPKGKKTIDFSTADFEKRYQWLGYHARTLLMSFMNEAINDGSITVDAFVYDIDEPDIIRNLTKLGDRLRIFLDNASLHTKISAVEPLVLNKLIESAGADHVKVGHFKRLAHNKVFIQKKNGQPVKVLTGSANFSVRGLYVQANNVLVFNDAEVARIYDDAFEQAFNDPTKSQKSFSGSHIASSFFEINLSGCPNCKVAFSPHLDANVSLGMISQEIEQADNSVLFAIMELGGTGPVLEKIRKLDTKEIFTYGITQDSQSINVYKAGSNRAKVVPFDYLKDKVPAPFKAEYGGGTGQVVHHKFVVVDFNDSDPVVFTGSSNLAEGGEKSNGDNLIAIFDRGIAIAYCVEAIRLLDHYDFRQAMKKATTVKPLMLKGADDKPRWWAPYFDEDKMKHRDRLVFSHPAEE